MTSGFGLVEERIAHQLETVSRGLLMTSPSKSFRYLTLDIETDVDTELEERWGFPSILPTEAFIEPGAVTKKTVDGVKEYLGTFDPMAVNPEWVAQVISAENGREKPRKQVIDVLTKAATNRADTIARFPLDPQLGRILTVAWAIDDNPVEGMVAGDNERDALMVLWDLLAGARWIVGWKVINFDLRFIFGRTVQNRLSPTRSISMRKFGNPDVIDLKVAVWGNDTGVKGLKQTARHFGIAIPAGDADGSKIGQMTIEEVLEYNKSDVAVTRALHELVGGMYDLAPVEYEDEIPF